jgi:TRAP-type C4-dicarboxylate transport system permease small subunit
MSVFAILTAVNDRLYKLLRALCGLLLAVFCICVFVQVVTRNYIHVNLPWTAELSLVCFVWGVMLGAAVGVRQCRHYVVDLLPQSCTRYIGILDVVATVISLYVFYVLVTAGYDFTVLGLARRGSSVPISMAWTFASIPVSGAAMLLFGLETLWKKIRAVKEGTCNE